jgi:hypothetical protein
MTPDAALERLKTLYFSATAATIADAFDEAIDLLKTLPSEEDRERAAVYMEGLAEMKHEFASSARPKPRSPQPSREKPRAPKPSRD